MMLKVLPLLLAVSIFSACTSRSSAVTAPSPAASDPASSGVKLAAQAAQPPFNLEVILRGEGFGLVKFRQVKDAAASVITLDTWVRDLVPNSSYTLQRAVDTVLDGVCTGTSWLSLGNGLTPASIDTDERGTGRADLWRDVSSIAAGTAFDIQFRVVQTGTTTHVALESGCYRYIVRD